MSAPVTVWIAALGKSEPSYGGWSYVRRGVDGTLAGAAGGERRVTGASMALEGLAEALASLGDLGPTIPTLIHLADPDLAAELKAGAGDGLAASLEPQAWARVRALLAARPGAALALLAVSTPAAGFVLAWAQFGLDTAKTRGKFKAALPRPNLLKFPG